MTEVTTTPETTTPEPAKVFVSKAQHIRQLRAENPSMSAVEIAKNVGTSETYVYMTLNAGKHKKVKAKPTPEKVVTDGQKVLRKEIAELISANEKWRNLNTFQEQRLKHLQNEVQKLKEHLVGHEYVISYLESRLGLDKKDGATV